MKYWLTFLILLSSLTTFSRQIQDTLETQLSDLPDEKKLTHLLKAGKKAVKSNPEKSLDYGRRANQLAVALKRPAEQGEACLVLSDGFLSKGRYDSSLVYAEQAYELYKRLGQRLGMMNAENQKGFIYLSKGDGVMAEKVLSRTIEECNLWLKKFPEKQGWKDLTAEVFNNLVMAYMKQGNYALAKKRLFGFRRAHPADRTFTGMLLLGNLGTLYMMTEQYDSALLYTKSALKIAIELREPLNESTGYTNIGNIYYSTGKYSEALKMYQTAIGILEPLNEKQQLSRLYNNLASVYNQINYYEKATHYFLESAKLKMMAADSVGLAVTYNNIGLVYKEMDNFAQARKYFDLAAILNRMRNNNKSLATNYNGIGDLYLQTGNADSALFYYRKALELKTRAGHKYGMVISMQGIGDVYSDLLQDDQQAIEFFSKALILAREIRSDHEIAGLNLSLGELKMNAGNPGDAGEMLLHALEYARKENALDLIRKSSGLLAELYIRKGDRNRAMEYLNLFRITSDSLYHEDKTKLTLEMQIRFETEKKEHENQLLLKSNEIQRTQIRGLILVAIVLLTLGSLALFLYRQKSVAYRQIVRKNLEILEEEKSRTREKEMIKKTPEMLQESENLKSVVNTPLGLIVKFSRLMEEEKPWLEPGITIEDLCRRLQTNRTYLSQMINDNYHRNFNNYINELRIREARRLLADPSCHHLSIEGIGSMSGFSTKAAFHSNFKQIVGVTPSYFRKTAGALSNQPAGRARTSSGN